jgi:hypothetical protein
MAEQASLAGANPLPAEASAWFAQINDALARRRNKDIIVYVHGASTTVERAAGQAAQSHPFRRRLCSTVAACPLYPHERAPSACYRPGFEPEAAV